MIDRLLYVFNCVKCVFLGLASWVSEGVIKLRLAIAWVFSRVGQPRSFLGVVSVLALLVLDSFGPLWSFVFGLAALFVKDGLLRLLRYGVWRGLLLSDVPSWPRIKWKRLSMHGSWRDIVSFLCLGPSCFMEFEPIAWRSANLVFVALKLTCLGVSLKKSCLVYGGLLLFMVLAPFSLMWLVYLPLSVFVLIFGFFPEEAVTSSYLAVRKARFYLLLFLWSAVLVGFLWEWPGVYYAARVSLLVVYGVSLFLTLILGCSADRWTPQGTFIAEDSYFREQPVKDAVVNYNFFFWPLLVARLGYPPRSLEGLFPPYDPSAWWARFWRHWWDACRGRREADAAFFVWFWGVVNTLGWVSWWLLSALLVLASISYCVL